MNFDKSAIFYWIIFKHFEYCSWCCLQKSIIAFNKSVIRYNLNYIAEKFNDFICKHIISVLFRWCCAFMIISRNKSKTLSSSLHEWKLKREKKNRCLTTGHESIQKLLISNQEKKIETKEKKYHLDKDLIDIKWKKKGYLNQSWNLRSMQNNIRAEMKWNF